MNEMPERPAARGRKRYVKPEVRQVPLRPDEAVLGNCKNVSTSGPAQATCSLPTPCSTLGS